VRSIAVLDRTKEPGSTGEPLLLDVTAALVDALHQRASETRPGHRRSLRAVVEGVHPGDGQGGLRRAGRRGARSRFTVGINDDVTHLSLDVDDPFDIEADDVTPGRVLRARLRRHGQLANKASIKIIGETTDLYAQGHFVYDSKKSGATTVSHLRFGPAADPLDLPDPPRRLRGRARPEPARPPRRARGGRPGRHGAAEHPVPADQVWIELPIEAQEARRQALPLYVIDASGIADEHGLGRRINTIMQTCFFASLLPRPRRRSVS
jgi:pyruvate-ferredoxin/flavodoxin oxidoreductase